MKKLIILGILILVIIGFLFAGFIEQPQEHKLKESSQPSLAILYYNDESVKVVCVNVSGTTIEFDVDSLENVTDWCLITL